MFKNKIRVYEDHTGRWHKDYTKKQYAKLLKDWKNDPLCQLLVKEIRKEINKEIIKKLNKYDFYS